jgi:hypothetical protein
MEKISCNRVTGADAVNSKGTRKGIEVFSRTHLVRPLNSRITRHVKNHILADIHCGLEERTEG